MARYHLIAIYTIERQLGHECASDVNYVVSNISVTLCKLCSCVCGTDGGNLPLIETRRSRRDFGEQANSTRHLWLGRAWAIIKYLYSTYTRSKHHGR
jgi:hypothetical protein